MYKRQVLVSLRSLLQVATGIRQKRMSLNVDLIAIKQAVRALVSALHPEFSDFVVSFMH